MQVKISVAVDPPGKSASDTVIVTFPFLLPVPEIHRTVARTSGADIYWLYRDKVGMRAIEDGPDSYRGVTIVGKYPGTGPGSMKEFDAFVGEAISTKRQEISRELRAKAKLSGTTETSKIEFGTPAPLLGSLHYASLIRRFQAERQTANYKWLKLRSA